MPLIVTANPLDDVSHRSAGSTEERAYEQGFRAVDPKGISEKFCVHLTSELTGGKTCQCSRETLNSRDSRS